MRKHAFQLDDFSLGVSSGSFYHILSDTKHQSPQRHSACCQSAVLCLGRTGEFGLTDVLGVKVLVLLILAFLLSGVLQTWIKKAPGNMLYRKHAGIRAAEWIILFGMFFLCFVMLVSNTYNPFIYFRF